MVDFTNEAPNTQVQATWLNGNGADVAVAVIAEQTGIRGLIQKNMYAYLNKDVLCTLTLIDAGGDLQARMVTDISDMVVYSDWVDIVPHAATIKGYALGPIPMPTIPGKDEFYYLYQIPSVGFGVQAIRTTGGPDNIRVDYGVALVGDIAKIVLPGVADRTRISVWDLSLIHI